MQFNSYREAATLIIIYASVTSTLPESENENYSCYSVRIEPWSHLSSFMSNIWSLMSNFYE